MNFFEFAEKYLYTDEKDVDINEEGAEVVYSINEGLVIEMKCAFVDYFLIVHDENGIHLSASLQDDCIELDVNKINAVVYAEKAVID